MNYNEIMEERLRRVEALFQRVTTLQYDLLQLREAVKDAQRPEIVDYPAFEQQQVVTHLDDVYKSVGTSIDNTKNAYEDIDIDEILSSLSVNLEL